MRLWVISDNTDTLTGMRLAGVEGVVAHERDEIRAAFKGAVKDKTIGVLLITEKLAAFCRDLIKQTRESGRSPLVVEIPDRHGTGRSPDSITRYIREAIGVELD